MDGGKVSLEVPQGWGTPQTDPTKQNYIVATPSSRVSGLEIQGDTAIATISRLGPGDSIFFTYGGGTGGDNNGVVVQDNIAVTKFTVSSDGDGDDLFELVEAEAIFDDLSASDKARNPKRLRKLFTYAENLNGDGVLQIDVVSATGGTGLAKVDPVKVRAAADDVKLTFTYTPSRTIRDGKLKFTVPSTGVGAWSPPQAENAGSPGFTEVEWERASLGTAEVDPDDSDSIIVPIIQIDREGKITIIYGSGSGAAMAPTAVGTSTFKISLQGSEEGDPFVELEADSPQVAIQAQASGKGDAVAIIADDPDDLAAGDSDRMIEIEYTAAGQMVAGTVQLTVPGDAAKDDGWASASADSVSVTASTGAALSITYGAGETAPTKLVTVDGVNLLAGQTITFVYTGGVGLVKKADVEFKVETNLASTDADYKADGFAAVDSEDTDVKLDVGYARKGSGMGSVSQRVIDTSATGVNLTFTYTAAGEIAYPKEFRVRVPGTSWSAPVNTTATADKGSFSVQHIDVEDGDTKRRTVEKLSVVGRDMVARVKSGILADFNVMAGDDIRFTYMNADAPTADEVSDFQIIFDGTQVAGDTSVRVQSSMATALGLKSAETVSADADAAPLAITVELQDSDGNMRGRETPATVRLASSSEGTFSLTDDGAGTATLTVLIPVGDSSKMVYYSDSIVGTPTITATAARLTTATHDVSVTSDVVELTSAILGPPTVAKVGDTVTVTATGTAGKAAMFSVGTIVTDRPMTGEGGTYTGSFDVIVDQHADGMYPVTVYLNGQSMAADDMLTIDSTDPVVAVTAPASAEDGETVMISATVTDAGTVSSVTADVSELDSTQTAMLTLAMATDGSYSASLEISDDNAAVNGAKTITVTAIDAAGNSGTGTASVMLDNMLSFTSVIPAGTSLFHVPLDVEGLDTVGNLKTMIGDAVNLVIIWNTAEARWDSNSDDVAITADLGVVLSMSAEASVTFEGAAWDGGISMVSLSAGANLVGLPVDDPSVDNVYDIITVAAGAVVSIVVSTDDGFASVGAASDAANVPVMGDAAYLVTATSATTIPLLGEGWSYGMAGAAPVALVGFNVDGQTAVLDVNGAIVDEITGLAREGFRVKVKNLSTKAALNKVTSAETAEGYNMTFVDLKAGHAARIGDVLEISADSPNPLIGVQPVRHTVTVDDVKSSTIQLEDLIVYEIPAETELLRNYPNPFNPETWIPYHLSEDADVNLTIYDISGEVVRDIDVGHQTAAKYDTRAKAIYWDGRNRFGEQVASGIYFYHLDAGDFSGTRKMVILK